MLIRICLIAAIVGALATVGFDIVLMNRKITATIAERDRFRSERDREALAKQAAQKLATETQADLKRTDAALAGVKAEREHAVATAAEQAKKSAALAENLAKSQADRKEAEKRLAAWNEIGMPIEKARDLIGSSRALKQDLEAVEAENGILFARVRRLAPAFGDRDFFPEDQLPEALTGTVLACDPKFDFVVLDVGDNQGVMENGQLLVHRKGKLIAKVKITDSIQPDRCIANVMPGWKLGEIMEGDEVFSR
jgi:hypothetical protein